MRIISPFRDFYDGVMKQGMDKDIIYVREPKIIPLDKKSYDVDAFRYRMTNREHYDVNLVLLGYCGAILHVYQVTRLTFDLKPIVTFNFYDFEKFKEFALEFGVASKYDLNFTSRWLKSSYQKFHEQSLSQAKELFHTYQVPLFLIKEEKRSKFLELNPSLKQFEFFKLHDPYTTYQDIYQYVSGVLNNPENKMVKISDKDKIAKHGFDKWSFRKKSNKGD